MAKTDDPLWRSAAVRAFLLYAATGLAGWACHLVWSDHEAVGKLATKIEVIGSQLEHIGNDVTDLKRDRYARAPNGTHKNP